MALLEIPDPGPGPEELLQRKELVKVWQVVEALQDVGVFEHTPMPGDELGMVLRCRYVHDMTWREVAKTMGLSVNQVRERHARALRALRHPTHTRYLNQHRDGWPWGRWSRLG